MYLTLEHLAKGHSGHQLPGVGHGKGRGNDDENLLVPTANLRNSNILLTYPRSLGMMTRTC